MFLNKVPFLTCSRYNSCFNGGTHIYNVFPGIINICNAGENIWNYVKKSTKIGLILVNFKICFCVKLKYYYQKFILERWLATSIVSTQFEFFQMLSCLLRFWVWNHLFDKRFCRISAIMQSLPEFFFVWQSSDLVMSWHARCLPKWGRKCSLFLPELLPAYACKLFNLRF